MASGHFFNKSFVEGQSMSLQTMSERGAYHTLAEKISRMDARLALRTRSRYAGPSGLPLETGQAACSPVECEYECESYSGANAEDDAWLNDVAPLQPRSISQKPIPKEQLEHTQFLTCWLQPFD